MKVREYIQENIKVFKLHFHWSYINFGWVGDMQTSLHNLFEEFLKKPSIFINKEALTPKYNPRQILHREDQIKLLAQILAPSLKFEKPSNVLIYGKPGTGKTVVTKYVCAQLELSAKSKGIPLDTLYLNCKMKKVADTEYRLFAYLCSLLGEQVPPTGLPTNEVYNRFVNVLDSKPRMLIIVLDEIDALVRKQGSDVLYNLTRMELENAKMSFIGISNDATLKDLLDPRVRSSLSQEEIVFPPYDALQLRDILWKRAEIAFSKGAVDEVIISKCAAYSASVDGDARKALDLLRIAGELAERENANSIREEHLNEAIKKMETDSVLEIVRKLTKHSLLVLYSTILLSKLRDVLTTGNVYSFYCKLCESIGLNPLTQRRVSDLLDELDVLGLIKAEVISKGRYGRTREISLSIKGEILDKICDLTKEVFGI